MVVPLRTTTLKDGPRLMPRWLEIVESHMIWQRDDSFHENGKILPVSVYFPPDFSDRLLMRKNSLGDELNV